MMGAKGSESEIMLMERMGSENGSGSSRKKDEDHNQKMGRRERSCWKSSKSCSSSKPSLLSDPFYSPISEVNFFDLSLSFFFYELMNFWVLIFGLIFFFLLCFWNVCFWQRMERSKVDHQMGHSRRASTSSNHRLLQSDHHFMEVDEKQETPNRNPNHHQTTRHALKDVCHSLTTSKQLLKVLSRVWSIEEQKSTCISLFATLRSELDRACLQVSRLIQDRTTAATQGHAEIDLVLKRFEEQKAVWRMKEECRIQTALASLLSELKAERKLRKQAERLNKRLGRELCEANTSLAMSTKEVETQKRAMQVLERVCEELARGGATEDNYKAPKLEEEQKEKKEQDEKSVGTKKMPESRLFEFEELKNEQGSYLAREEDIGGEGSVIWQSYSPSHEKLKALEKHLRETLPGGYPPPPPAGRGKEEEEEDDDDDEEEGELHCIELNMEEGGNNGGMGFESGSSEAWRNDYEDEIERYNMIKDLRDHFVSSSKIIPPS
ncbi:hypothetical protein DM860_009969 [Cuscuta australis]|uniref:Uncharacterized protein n=1 Tax=Cuscuta australis TaxID=267555 RepID=A0A328DBI7_9ASTE|nr:hypothetical protein DM860_009969 [Cuscuta australis]